MIEVLERRTTLEVLSSTVQRLEIREVAREIPDGSCVLTKLEILDRRTMMQARQTVTRLEIQMRCAAVVIERGVAGPQGSGGSIAHQAYQEFIVGADGQTAYTPLLHSPTSFDTVFINGLQQPRGEFSFTANTLSFNSGDGIIAGDLVGVFYFY